MADTTRGRAYVASERVTFKLGGLAPDLAEALAQFDTDGDGAVARDELVAAAEAYRDEKRTGKVWRDGGRVGGAEVVVRRRDAARARLLSVWAEPDSTWYLF